MVFLTDLFSLPLLLTASGGDRAADVRSNNQLWPEPSHFLAAMPAERKLDHQTGQEQYIFYFLFLSPSQEM